MCTIPSRATLVTGNGIIYIYINIYYENGNLHEMHQIQTKVVCMTNNSATGKPPHVNIFPSVVPIAVGV